jgi:hypothetical protein
MREAFEKWVTQNGKFPATVGQINGYYKREQTSLAWEVWRAAWLECQMSIATKSIPYPAPQTGEKKG